MLHNISPKILHNQFANIIACETDLFLSFRDDSVLVKEGPSKLWYPSFRDYIGKSPELITNSKYLFTIDDLRFFLVDPVDEDPENAWVYVPTSRFRSESKYWRSFAGVIGAQLNRWYDINRYCGKCGRPLEASQKERMLFCSSCGITRYPTISPSVIVGIYDQDRLLLTKYAGRAYTNFSLVAGYVEIGESLEDTVRREVLEEVGLHVKNIRYYGSQPWPFSDTLLAGFFAELDGDPTITLEEEELSLGVWVDRKELPIMPNNLSLTSEMIAAFRDGSWC